MNQKEKYIIAFKIYLYGITRDLIKEEYNLNRKQLAKIEREVIKELLKKEEGNWK
jgi:hypothetical protein